ncbi:hypothetical protein ANN_19244 [Periplaneta americana]|uniref:Uncharacterized protein n=1 Tax=Periplaneta americana TaxID=6978 RepID=A0ABQ8S9W9_PERAM|nr:hypothetical protein ANN_19244 [Periplaneta americana]
MRRAVLVQEPGRSATHSITEKEWELRLLAFDIAERNEILHRFSKEKRIAGKKWYYAVKRRHPQLNLRQPESISFARAKGFDKENFERNDVPVMKACTIEPVNEEIPEPNRPNTKIPEREQ